MFPALTFREFLGRGREELDQAGPGDPDPLDPSAVMILSVTTGQRAVSRSTGPEIGSSSGTFKVRTGPP